MHDIDKARSLYKQAIRADPMNSNTLGNYATFCWQTKKHNTAKAERYFKMAIAAAEAKGYGVHHWKHKHRKFTEALRAEVVKAKVEEQQERKRHQLAAIEEARKKEEERQRIEKEAKEKEERERGLISLVEKKAMTQFVEELFHSREKNIFQYMDEWEDAEAALMMTTTTSSQQDQDPVIDKGDDLHVAQMTNDEMVSLARFHTSGLEGLYNMERLLARLSGRKHFSSLLNQQRAKVRDFVFLIEFFFSNYTRNILTIHKHFTSILKHHQVEKNAFRMLCRLMWVALAECNEQQEYKSAKKLMQLSFTFYYLIPNNNNNNNNDKNGDNDNNSKQKEDNRATINDNKNNNIDESNGSIENNNEDNTANTEASESVRSSDISDTTSRSTTVASSINGDGQFAAILQDKAKVEAEFFDEFLNKKEEELLREKERKAKQEEEEQQQLQQQREREEGASSLSVQQQTKDLVVLEQEGTRKIYVQDTIKDAPIWKNEEYWSVAFYGTCILAEKPNYALSC